MTTSGQSSRGPWQWGDATCEEPWSCEIEYDCFKPGEPFVVSIHAWHSEDAKVPEETLITPSPEQAREMAAALLRNADGAERANKRREST